ncbi:MADS-box protein AeAP3-2 [Nymphaea thermarum]|nr:MADS-box protein AeAP3-2 [Nymphaea thermarum]
MTLFVKCAGGAGCTISYRRLILAIEFDKIPHHCQQIYSEMTKMKNENDKLQVAACPSHSSFSSSHGISALQATMRQLTGEDLTTLTKSDLKHLEKQLEVSLDRVR